MARAVASLRTENPLRKQPVERIVDLGAHFGELTDDGQANARGDWLNVPFLSTWLEGINQVQVAEAAVVADLEVLLEV